MEAGVRIGQRVIHLQVPEQMVAVHEERVGSGTSSSQLIKRPQDVTNQGDNI